MDILVAIKQVPDTDKVRMDPETGTMVREGVDSIVNPLDLYAIELAIRLREAHGGRVTAFTMGPPSADKALREAIAMGCDAGVLVTDKAFAGSDTWATSYVLSKAVAKLGAYDLILAGERATDGDTGQVGPCLGAWLDIPVLTYVSSIETSDAKGIVARRLVEEGYQLVRASLPCLLTVVKEVANPRLPTLRGKKFARQTKISVLGAADLDAESSWLGLKGSPTKVSRIFYPKVTRGGIMVKVAASSGAVVTTGSVVTTGGSVAAGAGGAGKGNAGTGMDQAVDQLVAFLEARDLIKPRDPMGRR